MELNALAPMAEQLFDDLRRLGDDGVGITRDSYGEGETAAADAVASEAAAGETPAECLLSLSSSHTNV